MGIYTHGFSIEFTLVRKSYLQVHARNSLDITYVVVRYKIYLNYWFIAS